MMLYYYYYIIIIIIIIIIIYNNHGRDNLSIVRHSLMKAVRRRLKRPSKNVRPVNDLKYNIMSVTFRTSLSVLCPFHYLH